MNVDQCVDNRARRISTLKVLSQQRPAPTAPIDKETPPSPTYHVLAFVVALAVSVEGFRVLSSAVPLGPRHSAPAAQRGALEQRQHRDGHDPK